MGLDSRLFDAKQRMTQSLVLFTRNNPTCDCHEVACSVDELNNAWDKLTDALVAQREERDRIIADLINQLAEVKQKR